jgi:hypothetical protein
MYCIVQKVCSNVLLTSRCIRGLWFYVVLHSPEKLQVAWHDRNAQLDFINANSIGNNSTVHHLRSLSFDHVTLKIDAIDDKEVQKLYARYAAGWDHDEDTGASGPPAIRETKRQPPNPTRSQPKPIANPEADPSLWLDIHGTALHTSCIISMECTCPR